jgi:outer membrane protein assembly factor BamB
MCAVPTFFPRAVSLLVLLNAAVAAVSLPAAEPPSWPRFHGAKNDNLSPETDLLQQWPAGGPQRLWTARGIGEGFATVAIANGLIYTCGNIRDRTVITALDLDGKIRWRAANGNAWTGSQSGTRGTPTIDGQWLYHESPLGDVVCLDAQTGAKRWGLNILQKFGSQNITWALAESLLIDGDHLICCPGGPAVAVVALDKNTGATIWKSPTAGGDLAGYSSPTLAEHAGLRMILTMTSRAVIGVNATTGDLLWRFVHRTPYDENIFTPVFHDGWVFISTGHTVGSVMLKILVNGNKASVEEVWRSKDLDNHHGGVILRDGHLYGSCWSSQWACLNWQTGQTLYRERGVGKGSVTFADGMLYTFGENGHVGLVRATPHGHKVISQFSLPEGGVGPSWAHPVVCGGRLYLRHGDFLYAYDIRQ